MEKNNRFNKDHDGPGAPQEREIRVLLLFPHVIRLTVQPSDTVKQILKKLEILGLKGLALGMEPSDFLLRPRERIFHKIEDGMLIYAFFEEGG